MSGTRDSGSSHPTNNDEPGHGTKERPRTEAEISAAIEQRIEEIQLEAEARKPPLLADVEGHPMQPAILGACPFPHDLLTRRFGYGLPLSDAEKVRCEQGQHLRVRRVIQRASVTCSAASVHLPAGTETAYRVGYFGHAEVTILAHVVHVEVICLTLSSPGGVNDEVRVYVDGALAGRGILFGRCGGGGDSFPAMVAITPALLLSVKPLGPWAMHTLIVEVARRA